MDYWATCTQCPFETNSPKQANRHGLDTGHEMTEDIEDDSE